MSNILLNDSYLYVIIALLPLAASMVVVQVNPYHALIIRGILGAVAALVYAVLGAADVALTEALVGTMLAITLYAVAVRSSMVMRMGVIEEELENGLENQLENKSEDELKEGAVNRTSLPDHTIDRQVTSRNHHPFEQLMNDLRTVLGKRHMRLEIVPYPNLQSLHQALMDKEIHAICTQTERLHPNDQNSGIHESEPPPYHIATRIQRLYEMMQSEHSSLGTRLAYISPAASPLDESLPTLKTPAFSTPEVGEDHP